MPAEVAQLVVHRVVQGVDAGVAPEAVQPIARRRGPGAGQLEQLAADLHGGAVGQHLGLGDGNRHGAAVSRGQRFALVQRLLQHLGRGVGQHLGRPHEQAQLAVAVLHERVVHGGRHARLEPGACFLAVEAQPGVQRALGDAQVEVGHDELCDLRSQRGPRAGRRAGRLQHQLRRQLDRMEAHRAAVGLALAEGVPVGMHGDARRGRRQHRDQWAVAGFMPGRQGQRVRADRAGGETLDAIEPVARGGVGRRQPLVQRVQGIAPEPALGQRLAQQALLLLGAAVEHQPGELQVMKAEQMRQRAVGLGEAAQHGIERRPARAEAAEVDRDRERQQPAVADQLTLGRRMAARLVACDGAGGQRARDRLRKREGVGRGQRRRPRRRGVVRKVQDGAHAAKRCKLPA
mmetsp:Transcript_5852/g.22973  ORF Transcript_5852/g.22973 Transcript_5852/m.22973 type:complete len:403 (-) Transcript_5852:3014-4222(-)